jgi:hypothetical protein
MDVDPPIPRHRHSQRFVNVRDDSFPASSAGTPAEGARNGHRAGPLTAQNLLQTIDAIRANLVK